MVEGLGFRVIVDFSVWGLEFLKYIGFRLRDFGLGFGIQGHCRFFGLGVRVFKVHRV